MSRSWCNSLLVAAALLAGTATARADTLLLQQSLPVDVAGTSFILVDRSWISHVMVSKDEGPSHRLTIRLASEPPVDLQLTCNDEAITRQVLDALRRGGAATLDVTGRCRL